MPTPTYTPIASTTLSGTFSAVTFSSIDQSFRDLVLVYNGSTTSPTDLLFYCNGDTGGADAVVRFLGESSGGVSGQVKNSAVMEVGLSYSGMQNSAIMHIMDYSVTDKDTVIISKSNNKNNVALYAARYNDTSAVTSIELTSNNSFASGSTFYLYGIEA